MNWVFWAMRAKDALQTAIFWKKFKTWQRERDARITQETLARLRAAQDKQELDAFCERRAREKDGGVPPTSLLSVILVAAILSMGATCGRQITKDAADLQTYCCVEHPEECRNLPFKIPCPVPTRTPTPTPTPAVPLPCDLGTRDCRGCVCPVAAPLCVGVGQGAAGAVFVCVSPPVTPTPLPTATVAPTPTSEPTATPICIPRPGDTPVSMAWSKRCPPYMREIAYLGNDGVKPPAGYATLCGLDLCQDLVVSRPEYYPNLCTWWRLGRGLAEGMELVNVRGAWVQMQVVGTSTIVCTDALGRRFNNCQSDALYTHPDYPAGVAEYAWGGYAVPTSFCADATPTPTPRPSPGPVAGCAAVEAIAHWMVGGGGCHAWHPMGDGRVHCVLDSTVRPICDTDHLENWNGFCGGQSHDPAGYDTAAGAQIWAIEGAEDRGPNCDSDGSQNCNSAQRVIVGPSGGTVRISVCLRPGSVTDAGCRISLTGDPCSRPAPWQLPQVGDP